MSSVGCESMGSAECTVVNDGRPDVIEKCEFASFDATDSRLLTVKEAAEIVRCHEETIRRAYLARQLRVQRVGVRSVRIYHQDLRRWLADGAPTRARCNRNIALERRSYGRPQDV